MIPDCVDDVSTVERDVDLLVVVVVVVVTVAVVGLPAHSYDQNQILR